MLENHFNLSKHGLTFGANGTYFSGGSQGMSDIRPFWKVDLYIEKYFLNRTLSVTVVVADLFDSYRPSSLIHHQGSQAQLSQIPHLPKATITIRYYLEQKRNRYDGQAATSEIDRL